MHPVDWIIVALLNGGIIAYGFYLARGTHSSSEWFLGRRALPWWAIGMSMFATNVDNADIVSVAGKTYATGLHILSVYSLGSILGGILAGFYIVPRMYRAGLYTNAEYLEARFGIGARILSALIQIQYRTTMLGLMLWSVYLLLTGLDVLSPNQAWILIVVLVICSGIYTAWGGLRSVVWTDALQGLVMMVGVAVIFCAVWQAAGGWSGAIENLTAQSQGQAEPNGNLERLTHIGHYDGSDGDYTPFQFSMGGKRFNPGAYVVVLGWSIIGGGYWVVNHTQTMRLMGARSIWDMKMAACVGVGISLPVMIALACLGVFGRSLSADELVKPDEIYPQLIKEYMGIGLKGLVVAAVVASAVSTVDSMGSALSAIFTRDIYARLFAPNKTDEHYVIVGRWATAGVLLIGFLYLPFIAMQRNMLDALTTLIPVFVTPLFAMYVIGAFTSVHRRSGMIGLLVGSAYGVFALYDRESRHIGWLYELDGVPAWLTDRWAALCWSFLITSIAILAASLSWRSQKEDEIQQVRQTGWLERSRESLPEFREHPFHNKVPPWAIPELYAIFITAISFYVVFVAFW